jgi:hypothetical protein
MEKSDGIKEITKTEKSEKGDKHTSSFPALCHTPSIFRPHPFLLFQIRSSTPSITINLINSSIGLIKWQQGF